jgi:formylglycine-generating enzyme required for sulfatase activity
MRAYGAWGKKMAEVLDWPVYVSLAEGKAYARWKDKRIPTEFEFHRAAFASPDHGQRNFPITSR